MGLFGKKSKRSSSSVAKDRITFVLTYDRSNTSQNTELIRHIKQDILKVISEYVEIDPEQFVFDINTSKNDSDGITSEFVANIPIKRVKKLPRNR